MPRPPEGVNMICKLRNKNGTFTVDGAFILLAIVAGLVISISVVGMLLQINKLNSITSELTRYIELQGQVGSAVYTELDRLATVAGMDDITCEVSDVMYIGSSQRIQFGESFVVTLSCTRSLGLGGVISVQIPLHSSVSGRSEKYWK